MRYILDASVAIAATRLTEPHHAAAAARVTSAMTGSDQLTIPSTFGIEVAGALGRAGVARRELRTFLDALTGPPHRVVTIGPTRSRAVQHVAIATKLRGADAVYVWLAHREDLPLCAIDAEVARRAAGFCRIIAP